VSNSAAATEHYHDSRGVLALMVDPTMGSIFWAKMLTATGVWMHGFVAAMVVFEATGSTLMVGLVSAAQFVPPLLLTPLSGTLADKGRVKQQILGGRALCVAGSGFLATWLWLFPDASDTKVVVVVLSASLVVGLGFVLGGPAMQSIVPAMVRPGELTTAIALNTAPATTSRVTGPIIGALVYQSLGPALTFGIAAATHLGLLLVMALVSVPEPDARDDDDGDRSVRAGLRHVRSDRLLAIYLLIVAAAACGAEPSLTLAPTLSEQLGGSTQLVGALTATFGLGAVAGMLIAARDQVEVRADLAMGLGLVFLAGGLGAVAAIPTVPSVLIALALAGVGFSVTLTSATAMVQKRTPDRFRGRIMGLWMVAFIGARPVGSTFVGILTDLVSARGALAVFAVSILAVAGACARPLSRQHYRMKLRRLSSAGAEQPSAPGYTPR
jgi:MFS family permease